MTIIVDARQRPKGEGSASHKRFHDRYKTDIKKAIDKAVGNGNITDIGKDGVDVHIPKRGIDEPHIGHGQGGMTKRVMPGNKSYNTGDRLKRPQGGGGGGGSQASQDGEGEDDFVFHVSQDEFLDYFFEDLGLPNMTKKGAMDSDKTRLKRSGISSSGSDDKRNLPFSARKRLMRKIPSESPYNNEILTLLEEKKAIFLAHVEGWTDPLAPAVQNENDFVPLSLKIENLESEIVRLRLDVDSKLSESDLARVQEIDDEIEGLERKKAAIPGWDPSVDLKFNNFARVPVPTSKAVMFCLMDVSGSMDEEKKYNAKTFYVLLHLFLKRHYEKVEVVFIRHHTEAEEVDEDRFFNDPTNGGTVVSTALHEMIRVMNERYPEHEWNIYGAQASDGDNWGESDNAVCAQLMRDNILPKVQGYFYTEITRGAPQGLWRTYETLKESFKDRFWTGRIKEKTDIWPVFREFFKKRENFDTASKPKAASWAP